MALGHDPADCCVALGKRFTLSASVLNEVSQASLRRGHLRKVLEARE